MMIQTTHVGSLPRPAEMITRQLRKEEITDEDLKTYVESIIERQIAVGLTFVNNGELPRSDYINSTMQRISGFDETCTAPLPKDMEELPEYSRRFSGRNALITLNPKAPVTLPACSTELAYTGEESLRRELDMLSAAYSEKVSQTGSGGTGLFFTAPSPGTLALFLENRYYPDYRTYLEKLGEVLRREYEIIAGYGMYLQIDCPDLAMGRHTTYKNLTDDEFLSIADVNIGVLNNSLVNIKPDMIRAHICWGNYPGTHHCDIELGKVLPAIGGLRARYISLESCNHRHAHEWEVFKNLPFPEDKILMPGVIDTNANTVEHPDLVAQRLGRFADILGPERVIGSTDCGFASTAGSASVSGEVAWLKLASLVEGAARASSVR